MKSDIESPADIERVVRSFYEQVRSDELIGFFFSEIVAVDWDRHLPLMCSFWENVLFYTGDYEGNPIETHRHIYSLHATKAEHFDRWLALFTTTVDELYEGRKATIMKDRAAGLAAIMREKVVDGGFR